MPDDQAINAAVRQAILDELLRQSESDDLSWIGRKGNDGTGPVDVMRGKLISIDGCIDIDALSAAIVTALSKPVAPLPATGS
jgi:hypothetical protein